MSNGVKPADAPPPLVEHNKEDVAMGKVLAEAAFNSDTHVEMKKSIAEQEAIKKDACNMSALVSGQSELVKGAAENQATHTRLMGELAVCHRHSYQYGKANAYLESHIASVLEMRIAKKAHGKATYDSGLAIEEMKSLLAESLARSAAQETLNSAQETRLVGLQEKLDNHTSLVSQMGQTMTQMLSSLAG